MHRYAFNTAVNIALPQLMANNAPLCAVQSPYLTKAALSAAVNAALMSSSVFHAAGYDYSVSHYKTPTADLIVTITTIITLQPWKFRHWRRASNLPSEQLT